MSIQTAIYKALAEDATLSGLLARSTINEGAPAIYEHWADENTPTPYINLSFSTTEANHWAKRETSLDVDIFAHQNTILAETIKNRVIKILDRQKIELENQHFARVHSNSDSLIIEPAPHVTHWNINFSVFYWRKTWIERNETT